MIEIIKYGKFSGFEKNKKKSQIILCDSYRNSQNYLEGLKNRINGKYKKIPNYLITREGKIINLLSDDSYSNFFSDDIINKNSIIICLENLGWVKKIPLSKKYYNWIDDIYIDEVHDKKWRNHIHWSKYTEEQMNSLIELCKKLLKKFSIKNKFIGHNTKVDGVKIFNGVVCRSNYSVRYLDPNPSFNFESFKKSIENE
jgi:N-acetyl-anhydromuramyl-L-alanine amidase AmpD